MQGNNFYTKGGSNSGMPMINMDNTPVFNASGNASLLNTKQVRGFKNAMGAFYGADGTDASAAPSSTTTTSTTTAATNAAPATTVDGDKIGMNMSTLFVLLVGFGIGYFICKENVM